MPKSKRDKRVSLTQTKKKGLEAKQNLVEEVRKCVELYERVFIFSVQNMRNSKLKEVRSAWKHSRFFFGKNKVMAIALGRTAETEVKEGLHQLAANLVNEVGVLFTCKTKDEVISWFGNYLEHDFARAGNVATSTVELDEGPLLQFSHAIEPHLRKLGLPVTLNKGVVTMLTKHAVCKEGDILTPEQTSILKLLNIVLTEFRIHLQCVWDKESGKFEMLESQEQQKVFNTVRVTSDDQEYDFVEKENMKEETAKISPQDGKQDVSKKVPATTVEHENDIVMEEQMVEIVKKTPKSKKPAKKDVHTTANKQESEDTMEQKQEETVKKTIKPKKPAKKDVPTTTHTQENDAMVEESAKKTSKPKKANKEEEDDIFATPRRSMRLKKK